MDKEFLAWFTKYYRVNWEVGPDTYSREEAEEIAFAAWQAAQQSVQATGQQSRLKKVSSKKVSRAGSPRA